MVFLDCYNNTVHTDIAPTITTRIYDSNQYWIMEQEPRIEVIGNIYGTSTRGHAAGVVVGTGGGGIYINPSRR